MADIPIPAFQQLWRGRTGIRGAGNNYCRIADTEALWPDSAEPSAVRFRMVGGDPDEPAECLGLSDFLGQFEYISRL